MQEISKLSLPWSWQQKVADFQKVTDLVCTIPAGVTPAQALAGAEDNSCHLVLSPNAPCGEEDYREVHRVLKKGGFFLTQQLGGDDCRRLCELLHPGAHPAQPRNAENHTPLLRAAGFRVMFRDQAYPVQRFSSVASLLAFVSDHPGLFPGITEEHIAEKKDKLQELLTGNGSLPLERHVFLLIGKRQ